MGGPGDASKALVTGKGTADARLYRINGADALRSLECAADPLQEPGDAADALCTLGGAADALYKP